MHTSLVSISQAICLAMLVGVGGMPSPAAHGGDLPPPGQRTVSVVLDLAPPADGANQFQVDTALNTLVPGRDVERASGAVDWSGQLELLLHLGVSGGGLPVVHGVELPETNLAIVQSPIALVYQNLPVDVQFVTSELTTRVAATSGAVLPVAGGGQPGQYEFTPSALEVTQTAGTASVVVPQRPTETQQLSIQPARATAGDPDPTQSEAGSVVLDVLGQQDESTTYQVALEVPLAGSRLHFPGTGLPVDWQYATGRMVATGTFVLEGTVIPEPAGVAIALGLLATAAAARLRTAG